MSLTFALAAAVNGSTGPRAILIDGLVRTKQPRRRSGQHQRRGFSSRRGGRARAAGNTHSSSADALARGGQAGSAASSAECCWWDAARGWCSVGGLLVGVGGDDRPAEADESPARRRTVISPDSASTTHATTFAACTSRPTQVRTLVTVGSSYAVVGPPRRCQLRGYKAPPRSRGGTGQLLPVRPDDNLHMV